MDHQNGQWATLRSIGGTAGRTCNFWNFAFSFYLGYMVLHNVYCYIVIWFIWIQFDYHMFNLWIKVANLVIAFYICICIEREYMKCVTELMPIIIWEFFFDWQEDMGFHLLMLFLLEREELCKIVGLFSWLHMRMSERNYCNNHIVIENFNLRLRMTPPYPWVIKII